MNDASDNRTTEKLMREFVAVACECEVRDYLISEYAERIEQAIADELNAKLGSETCEDISIRYGLFICSACGCKVLEECVDFGVINYCPDCGREVER